MFFCWRPQQTIDHQLPTPLSSRSLAEDFFHPCPIHEKQIAFICKSQQCRDKSDSMVCNQCLAKHKDHDWITKDDFLTPNICNILTFNKAETDQILQNTLNKLLEQLNQMESQIINQFEQIRDQLERSISNIENKYHFKIDSTIGSSRVILNPLKLEKVLNIYEIQQSKFEWIKIMEESVLNISNQINTSIKFLLQDLMNVANAQKWEFKDLHVDQLKQFQKHLHKHSVDESRYHLFSSMDKHMNIRLNKNLDEATYVRAVPSKPIIVGTQYISHVHNKFGFQILKMDSKAIFFDSTIVFVGICSSNIVRSCGFRKVNEYGKGAYLISSQGWAYHSTNQDYNNKEVVGWGFGQGDKILVQIIFDDECMIKFTKKGRFFESTFQMPLMLNEFQMNRLKPCVGFDSEQGAIVKIFDVDQLPLETAL